LLKVKLFLFILCCHIPLSIKIYFSLEFILANDEVVDVDVLVTSNDYGVFLGVLVSLRILVLLAQLARCLC